jgi:putative superfamily III holin-X
MSETSEQAQEGVAGAVRGLSDNTRALVRHEIVAVQKEALGKVRQAWPAAGLLGAAAFFGVLTAAASFRLSIRLLEKSLSPATAALTATAGYAVAAGAAGAMGIQQLRAAPSVLPAETVKAAAAKAKTTATKAKTAASRAKTAASKPAASTAKPAAGQPTAATRAKATASKPAASKAAASKATASRAAASRAKPATSR